MSEVLFKSIAAHANRSGYKPALLLQQAQRAKGGVIGTNGKGVVALRFDDYQDAFRTNIYPLLAARGLPASMALISRFNTAQSWGAGTTWADIISWNRNGVEMWSHGTNHNDYIPEGYAGLYREIVTSKAEIEAQGIKCKGWIKPGVTPLTAATPYDGLASLSDWGESEVGRLIIDNYAISEAYAGGSYRLLPTKQHHGLDHQTISEGVTLANAQAKLDMIADRGYGIEFMIHSGNIGESGNMSLAEFTTFLDYIVTKWEAGLIDVLTPSGLCFADPGTSRRLNLLISESFETASQWSLGSSCTIETSGGRTGNNFARIPNTVTTSVAQYPDSLQALGLGGEHFIFEGWFRSNGAANTVGRVIIQDSDDSNRLNISKTKASNGSTWTRMRFAFGLHPDTNRLVIALTRSNQDGVDWDDVSVKII